MIFTRITGIVSDIFCQLPVESKKKIVDFVDDQPTATSALKRFAEWHESIFQHSGCNCPREICAINHLSKGIDYYFAVPVKTVIERVFQAGSYEAQKLYQKDQKEV